MDHAELTKFLEEHDAKLRGFARRSNPEMGEDAYHAAVLSMYARKNSDRVITHLKTYVYRSIEFSLYKFYRKQLNDRTMSYRYIQGFAPEAWARLRQHRPQKQTHCRRGHPFTDDNVVMSGKQRTCKTCLQARKKAYWQQRKAAGLVGPRQRKQIDAPIDQFFTEEGYDQ